MDKLIVNELEKLEAANNCKIIFACESGSRAWGFAAPDSDYDVRFIYVNPWSWYLRLEEHTDVINKVLPQSHVDLSGWDLQKTLRLFASCNPGLNEWLNTPSTYFKDENFWQQLKNLIPDYFNPKKAAFHYHSLAKKIIIEHSQTTSISIKKLFYIFRSLLACRWIIDKRSMPPTAFQEIMQVLQLPSELQEFIDALLAEKRQSNEQHIVQIPNTIFTWIHEELAILEKEANGLPAATAVKWSPLNDLFLAMLGDKNRPMQDVE